MLTARYHLYLSTVLDASLDVVWPVLRDMMQLLPLAFEDAVTDYRWVEGGSADHIPARFQFTLQPGDFQIREEVVGRSEPEHSLTYRTLGPALAFAEYLSTLRLKPITDDPSRTFLEWSRDFSLVEGTDAAPFLAMYGDLAAQEVARVKARFAAMAGSS